VERKLKRNERLVYAGKAPRRARDGSPLPSISQFIIVPVDEADPARVYRLGKDEHVILAGVMCENMASARERFAALQAGREPPPKEEGTPLYFVTDKEGLRLHEEEQNAINDDMAKAILPLFVEYVKEQEKLKRQGNTTD
jgi:hypothetical protein